MHKISTSDRPKGKSNYSYASHYSHSAQSMTKFEEAYVRLSQATRAFGFFATIGVVVTLAAATPVKGAEIQVSPDGPITSMAAARDAVRAARAAGDHSPARVLFRDGQYFLTEPVVFGPEDSDATYEAAPEAHPTFLGGRKITGFTESNGVWTAHVDPAFRFEALWVNGARAVRARTPNVDAQGLPDHLIRAMRVPPAPLPGVKSKGDAEHTLLQCPPEDLASLKGLTAEELRDVNVCDFHAWDFYRHRIAGFDPGSGILQFIAGDGYAFYKPEPFQTLYLENYRAALDAAGEWFLARDGVLSYIPQAYEKLETAEIWAPEAEKWLVIHGDTAKQRPVEKLTFRGLSFAFQSYHLPDEGEFLGQADNTLGAAIESTSARDLLFERCEFAHTMTYALAAQRACSAITVRDCWFHDLGAGAVKIGDPEAHDKGPDQTDHVTVENCVIHGGGRYFPSAVGVLIFRASDCAVRHCDIADLYYSGISVGWTWGYGATPAARNIVEGCHIHHLGWGLMSDMGAVYTLGAQPGTVIRNCHFHDIGCASYGGWGMYNDEGSTGILWENNLVHDTQDAGYHIHYGRDNIVRNNIFAFCEEEHVRRSRPETFTAFTFERNIVLLGNGMLFAPEIKSWTDGRFTLANNIYWRPGELQKDFAGNSWEKWQALGRDAGSLVADPLFVDPAHGDWTLPPESPALKVGFKPFDWRAAGVTGDATFRKQAAETFPPMRYGHRPPPPPLNLHEDFETTPVGGKPAGAQQGVKKPETLVVVEGGASQGKRCLQLTDGPEITPFFDPHFYYTPHHNRGESRVAFDVRAEPAFHLVHEWRDDAVPYHTGPALEFIGGEVRVRGFKLADFPPGKWMHVEITAKLGEACDQFWNCVLTVQGEAPQKFTGLHFVDAEMSHMDWLGFSSPGKETAKCWLDEIDIRGHGD